MKKKIIALAFLLLVFVASIVYLIKINTKFESSVTDAESFKKEYEVLNGELVGNTDKIYREVTIDENNTVVLSNYSDIVSRINNKETFIVYFGFAKCPWCRSVIEVFLNEAKENNINVYYVDVYSNRDTYELVEKVPTKKSDASKEYYELLKKLDSLLSDYNLTDEDGNKVPVGEKRIYAPNMVAVVDGKPMYLTTGVSPLQNDAYMALTDEMINYSKEEFNKLFSYLEETKCTSKGC